MNSGLVGRMSATPVLLLIGRGQALKTRLDGIYMLFFSITGVDARAILLGFRRLGLFCGFFLSALLVAIPATPQDPPPDTSPLGASELFGRVIANQKKSEANLDQ